MAEQLAGGAYPAPLLRPFRATIGPWLPPRAATHAVRGIVYFDGTGAGRALLVLGAYPLVGPLATLAGAGRSTPEASASGTSAPA